MATFSQTQLTLVLSVVMFTVGVVIVLNEAFIGTDRGNVLYVGFACLAAGCFGRAYAHLERMNGK